jgi:hypothetical protein
MNVEFEKCQRRRGHHKTLQRLSQTRMSLGEQHEHMKTCSFFSKNYQQKLKFRKKLQPPQNALNG